MGARPKAPLFLARSSYRQRRLRDASRLLPVAVGVLWLLPLLWTEARTSVVLVWTFAVWTGAIVAAAVLSATLRPDEDGRSDEPG